MNVPDSSDLRALCQAVDRDCIRCGACAAHCSFLQERGLPGDLAAQHGANPPASRALAFECSHCGLCDAVCPKSLSPMKFFLALRRETVERGEADLARYRDVFSYEDWGCSPLLSASMLPEGCRTVLFPGCNLPGTRPKAVWALFQHLRRSDPSLGLVLDCCGEMSHDLGFTERFHGIFDGLLRRLTDRGVDTVLTACPNCYQMFAQYGRGVSVRMAWEDLARVELPRGGTASGAVAVHDPCPVRGRPEVHGAARDILRHAGVEPEEMVHSRAHTFCCGGGGAVAFVRPDFAQAWGRRRLEEAAGRRIATYCAGCVQRLADGGGAVHVLDLLFGLPASPSGEAAATVRPYLRRWLLKRRARRALR